MRIIISFGWMVLFAFTVFAQTQAEIIVPTTFLRKSPNPTAEKLQTLQRGEKITLEKTQDTNGWYYVSILSGKSKGWVNGNTFQTYEAETAPVKETPPISQPPKTDVSQPRKETVSPPRKEAASQPAKTPGGDAPKTTAPVSAPTVRPQPNKTSTPASASGPPVSTRTQPVVKPAASLPSPVPSPAPSPAATVAEDDEVLRIETEEVNLNIRVVDGNNRPVNNLGESQFKVYEDSVLQPITSLTTTEVPIVNALVVDNSRSLRTQLEKVIEAGKILVGTNRPQDESSIVRFVSADKIEVMRDFTTKKDLLENALSNLFIEGGQTAIIDAVYLTAKRLAQYQNSNKKEDVRRRALIVVSDGDDRSSTFNEQQLFDLLRASDVQVYAVGFVSGLSSTVAAGEQQSRQEKARSLLTRLAEETGGKVYFPNSTDELARIANEISADLRTQYLITYAPTNEKRDKTFRNIKVEVAGGAGGEKRTAITRTGRLAAPEEKPAPKSPRKP